MQIEQLQQAIREIPDFPKPGINFKDITPLLENPTLCNQVADEFANIAKSMQANVIVGVESRGFIFGMLIANKLQIPFVPIRKKGKLPFKTVSYAYDLEYGSAEVEMHKNVINSQSKVLIHDDLLATGGTAAAAAELIKMEGGQVMGFAFLIELAFLNGTQKLKQYSSNIQSLLTY